MLSIQHYKITKTRELCRESQLVHFFQDDFDQKKDVMDSVVSATYK